MCTSKSKGGQRCVSGARKTLTKAKATYTALAAAAKVHLDAGQQVPEALVRKGMASQYRLEDAMAVYASTVQGEADLREQAKAAPGWHQVNRYAPGVLDKSDFDEALREGLFLRARNARIKAAVKAGQMTAMRAKIEAEYPMPGAAERRAREIDAAIERRALDSARRSAAPAPAAAPAVPAVTTITFGGDGGLSGAEIEQDPDGRWRCGAVWRDEDTGETISEEDTFHPTRFEAQSHADALALEHGSWSPSQVERIEAMNAYYERYDANLRKALTADGAAELRARLATLPAVGGGYGVSGNVSPQVSEALEIHEALEEARLLAGTDPATIPTAMALGYRRRNMMRSVTVGMSE